MKKQEFLSELRIKISGLPGVDVEERISFYSEMIDDRIEDGMSEEEAVLEIGSVEDVAMEIIGNTPLKKIVKEKIKPYRGWKTSKIIFVSISSLIWIPLLVAAFSVALALYVSLWSIVVSVYAVFASCALSVPFGLVVGAFHAFSGNSFFAVLLVSCCFALAGIGILSFLCAKALTRLTLLLTKKLTLKIKKKLVSGENK